MQNKMIVIGGGLAGCEAAWQLAAHRIPVDLIEMKPVKYTPAHTYAGFAELVCSNSLRSDRIENAVGLLKAELRELGSLILQCADATRVEAGGALAVDRQEFSDLVTEKIQSNPYITVCREEVKEIPEGHVIVATGPLTSEKLAEDIGRRIGGGYLHFYDASAPIVAADSVNMYRAFFASRYGRGSADYINCPMDKDTYERLVDGLLTAEKAQLHEFEKREIFEGCMPVEVMASRGKDTLRYGTLKPVGLWDRDGRRPYAVLQLRRENASGTAYNLVGCQTNLKFPEQKRVFSMIPALKNAEFLRYGVMHRNTYIQSPDVLRRDFSVKNNGSLYFAGQMTGVEGYVESAASGLLAAVHLADKILGRPARVFDDRTICGALETYISTPNKDFQPMNANFGILAPLAERIRDKRERYRALAERSLAVMREILGEEGIRENSSVPQE